MNGTSKPSSSSTAPQKPLDADIALLASLLAQSGDEGDVEGLELQELLQRLETADGVAQGVEHRLDEIIGNLDQMLGGLEDAGETGQKREGQGEQDKAEGEKAK
ncbi:uncharacterized protein PHACADRAFT_204967 [Phanerochaete carnosa HHB-10118-sp]|uniref:Uncharacterized protein n=1 Tax=Phanerochaete carnosa (strain HHB-10118-sp) TaxID=650164 RepID=K5VFP9_PHACS|nr:uncharacterized protein PHACADRAFT_204967 [Phanerochaete carnosa HHB-10118-sp]EKM61826.1 hypothetical protein PHACADRAFT_204967 [Phanerochaete carnosa HHB-10118-sp]